MSQRRVALRPPSSHPHFFRRGGCSCCAEAASFLLAAASATATAWATCVCRACSSIWLDERRMKAKRPDDRRASSCPCPPHAGAEYASSAARTSATRILVRARKGLFESLRSFLLQLVPSRFSEYNTPDERKTHTKPLQHPFSYQKKCFRNGNFGNLSFFCVLCFIIQLLSKIKCNSTIASPLPHAVGHGLKAGCFLLHLLRASSETVK